MLVNANGDIELYDYKTDRLTSAEQEDYASALARLSKDHGNQLTYYAKAAALLFGRPCTRVAIYSTASGELYDVNTEDDKINIGDLMSE